MMASFLYLSSESHLIPKWRHTQNAWAVGGVSEVLATLWVLTSHQPLGIHAAWGAPPPAPRGEKDAWGKTQSHLMPHAGLGPVEEGAGRGRAGGMGMLGGWGFRKKSDTQGSEITIEMALSCTSG